MSANTVVVEKSGPVTTIILNRPEVRNAVNPVTAKAIFEAFLAFDADADAAVAVLTGTDGAFCAGYDLKHTSTLDKAALPLADYDIPADWPGGQGGEIHMGPMGASRLTLSKPVIGAIAGPAVAGGMELAMWCDMRVMEETAYMGVYCRRWGVPLIDGGTQRLPRLVGEGRAMDLILTGRQVMAEECAQIGLCERVVAPGTARAKAEKIAHDISRFPQGCMRADRLAAKQALGLPLHEGLKREWQSREIVEKEAVDGAARFAAGHGRGGNFEDI